jgi:nucleoid-associated protein YgaU
VLNESAAVALTVQAAALPAVPTVSQPAVDAAGAVTVSGTGVPSATVEIVEDGTVVGTAVVQTDGSWTFTYKPAAGEHTLAAQNQGQTGSTSVSYKLDVAAAGTGAAEAPTGSQVSQGNVYVVKRGDWLKKIAQALWGDGNLYMLIVDATNAKAAEDSTFRKITNPDLIYPGQKLWIPDR